MTSPRSIITSESVLLRSVTTMGSDVTKMGETSTTGVNRAFTRPAKWRGRRRSRFVRPLWHSERFHAGGGGKSERRIQVGFWLENVYFFKVATPTKILTSTNVKRTKENDPVRTLWFPDETFGHCANWRSKNFTFLFGTTKTRLKKQKRLSEKQTRVQFTPFPNAFVLDEKVWKKCWNGLFLVSKPGGWGYSPAFAPCF